MTTTKNNKPVILSEWKGSVATLSLVASEINNRYGSEEVKRYNPTTNCFTFNTWKAKGYQVNKGEKAIKSITFVPTGRVSPESGKDEMFPKTVCLFYYLQVEKITT